jgi:hypothetical protein
MLGGDAGSFVDEAGCGHSVCFGYPPHPAFPNHVHRFDPLQCPPRTPERAVAFRQLGPFLYRAMILFHHIVEVLALTQPDATGRTPFPFRACTADGKAGFLSTLMTRATGLPGQFRALRKKRLAATASRFAVRIDSIV